MVPLQFKPGDHVTGYSCTDIPGLRTGSFVRIFTAEYSSREVAELIDERDGKPSFVHVDSLHAAVPTDAALARMRRKLDNLLGIVHTIESAAANLVVEINLIEAALAGQKAGGR